MKISKDWLSRFFCAVTKLIFNFLKSEFGDNEADDKNKNTSEQKKLSYST